MAATAYGIWDHWDSSKSLDILRIGNIEVVVPDRNIRPGSVELVNGVDQSFRKWTRADHIDSHHHLKQIALIWKDRNPQINDYLVYGCHIQNQPFTWLVVPYFPWETGWRSLVSQANVLFWLAFSTTWNDQKERTAEQKQWRLDFQKRYLLPSPEISSNAKLLEEERLAVQQIIEKEHSILLYQFRPINTGGEEIQFLIIPKVAKKTFIDLSKEEYLDMMEMLNQLIGWTEKNLDIVSIHIFHKNGKNAGQSVEPFHIHFIALTKEASEFKGRVNMALNMAWPSKPLSDTETKRRADHYHEQITKYIVESSSNPISE